MPEPLLDNLIVSLAFGNDLLLEILDFTEHKLVKLRLVDPVRSAVLLAVSMIAVTGVFNVFFAAPGSVFRYEVGAALLIVFFP